MASDVVALPQVLGGPTSAAVLPLAVTDGMWPGGAGEAADLTPEGVVAAMRETSDLGPGAPSHTFG